MLLKIEEFDGENIEEMKIYFDEETKQYKCKHVCCICGKTLSCMCYESLEGAYSDNCSRWYCNEHYVKEFWTDFSDVIDYVCGTNLCEMMYNNDDAYDRCQEIVKNLTKEDCEEIIKEFDYDIECYGDPCNI